MILKHNKIRSALGIGLAFSLSSCASVPFLGGEQQPSAPSPSPTASSSPAPTAQPATSVKTATPTKPKGKPPLTVAKLKNTEYFILAEGPVKLTKGKFQDKKKRSFALGDPVTYGDLNRDGVKDAVAPLVITIDGRNFTYLVGVLNENGNPKNTSADFLGEGVKVKTLSANAGKITVKLDKYGPNDPACCPSETITRTYTYTPFNQTQAANKDKKDKKDKKSQKETKATKDNSAKPSPKPSPTN